MSSGDDFAGAGSGGALDRLAAALEERNEHIAELITTVRESTGEVRRLQRRIHERPTRTENAHRRRTAIAVLIVYGWLIVTGHDAHVEACSPGWRAEQIIDRAILTDEVVDNERLREIASTPPATHCDVLFPLHTHERGGWPSEANLLGILLHTLLGVVLFVWGSGPRRWRRGQHDLEATVADGDSVPPA